MRKSGRNAAKKRTKAGATITALAKASRPVGAASTLASRRSRVVAHGNSTPLPWPKLN